MIKIGKPYVVVDDKYAYLKAHIEIDDDTANNFKTNTLENFKKSYWQTHVDYPAKIWSDPDSGLFIRVDKKYKEFLCYERSDAFVMIFIFYALIAQSDISFEAPMSKKLFDLLNAKLLKKLCNNKIKLYGPTTSEIIKNAGSVATGMTCGVDSFYTVKTKPISHIVRFIHGAEFYERNDKNLTIKDLYDYSYNKSLDYIKPAAEVAKLSNLDFIHIYSNLEKDYFRGGYRHNVMFRIAFSVLALQKLFDTYYVSSSGNGKDVDFDITKSSQCYENLFCESCQTENFQLLLSDNDKRFDKIVLLADDKICQQYLDVCFNEHVNDYSCGECMGCMKTIFVLDLIGKLGRFDKVFDLKRYNRDREKIVKSFIYWAQQPEVPSNKVSLLDMLDYAKKHDSELGKMLIKESKNII